MRTRGGERGAGHLWLLGGVAVGAVVTLALVLAALAFIDRGTPDTALDPPHFVDETATSGMNHSYRGGFDFFVGGGVAVFDCNGDQRPDVYLAGGEAPATLYRNESTTGGDLRFEKISDPATDMTSVTGAFPLDVDGDGLIDLAVVRFGENVMLRGLGDCRFEPANQDWSVDGGNDWTVAFSAKWEEGASLPSLAFGNYVALDEGGNQDGCSDNYLIRPGGRTYGTPITLSPGYCTLSILFSDWDRSGRGDLRMTNDRHYYRDGEEQMWRVAPGEAPRLYTAADGWQTMQIWGMGIANYDLTGDGLPEVFLTSQGDNKLQTLAAGPSEPDYEDVAFVRGATAHRPFAGDVNLPSTAWHPEFEDVNNDGLVDLFVTKGNVEAQPDYAARDPNNLMLQNPDGTFTEAATSAGVLDFNRSRGAALADLNSDGMLDLIVVDREEPVKVWRSLGWGAPGAPANMGHWLSLKLSQDRPNRDAIGAWMEVRVGNRTQQRQVTVGGGHGGGQLGWVHFGLGSAREARVRVQWPDGDMGPWMKIQADQFVVLDRSADHPRTWTPPAG